MHVQLVRMEVLQGCRDAFLAAMGANVAAARREPGCLRFDLLGDPDDPLVFFAYEVFADAAALQTHRATPQYRDCIAAIGPLTRGSGSKTVYTPVMVAD